MKLVLRIFALMFALTFLIPNTSAFAQTDDTEILAPGAYGEGSREVTAQLIDVQIVASAEDHSKQYRLTAKDEDENSYTIDTRESFPEGVWYRLNVGDTVYLQVFDTASGEAFLTDVKRTGRLVWILVLFAIVVIAIGLRRGVHAILGLAVTVGIVGVFVLPKILAGSDPVLVCGLASAAILAVTMHVAHGFNRRTATAFASTIIGLGTVYGCAVFFVWFAQLSGLGSEEELLLYIHSGAIRVPSGILLGTIILGAAGALDDIAITQTETVAELRDANPTLTSKELFTRAMRIGRHHIASIVNTLVLAYTSVALPMLLLFMMSTNVSIWQLLNLEGVVAEIVRTVAGTMGLLLTVPISTALAAFAGIRGSHEHVHPTTHQSA